MTRTIVLVGNPTTVAALRAAYANFPNIVVVDSQDMPADEAVPELPLAEPPSHHFYLVDREVRPFAPRHVPHTHPRSPRETFRRKK